jgi:hypothetical protein
MTRAQFDDAIEGATKGGLLNGNEAAAARARVSGLGDA